MNKHFSLAIVALLMCATIAFGAEANANRVKQQKARLFGITAGYTQTSMYETAPLLGTHISRNDDIDRYHGAQAGLVINPEFGAGIGILTGVKYIYTPTYQRIGKPSNYVETFISKQDLAIPLRIQYRYAFTPGFSIFAYTGPSFNVGLIWNRRTTEVTNKETINSNKVSFYDDNNNYARFHCFWGLGLGIIFNQHLRIEYCADWGLNNITPYTDKFTHLNLPVTVGVSYMF